MKKLLILSNILTLSILCFWGCNKDKSCEGPNCPEKSCVVCKDYSNLPNDFLTSGTAASMANLYKARNTVTGAPSSTTPDARAAWFSLETLKKFIWKIEKGVCDVNCIDKKNLGIRFYYAQYPSAAAMSASSNLNTVPASYEYRHTLFLVPTYRNNNGGQTDFDPYVKDASGCPQTIKSIILGPTGQLRNDTAKLTILSPASKMLDGNGNTIQNHGGLYPPEANEDTGF